MLRHEARCGPQAKYAINYSMLQLYLFMMSLFYLSHFLACGWYLVISLEGNKECVIFPSWVESQVQYTHSVS